MRSTLIFSVSWTPQDCSGEGVWMRDVEFLLVVMAATHAGRHFRLTDVAGTVVNDVLS
jgi:hypothetical protein